MVQGSGLRVDGDLLAVAGELRDRVALERERGQEIPPPPPPQ